MSIIDIEQSKTLSNSAGVGKTIDENALSLILDNVQISQYVYPENSTVRELTSNAVDSQKEKEKAIEILSGKAKVEDYYIKRDDIKYEDSNFNPAYYNIEKLNKTNNTVQLTYIIGKEGVGWCDKFIVKDNGVGLGDKRLYGYFQIGYSTKRNTVSQLGGFGLGAKVGLSLRNDYFTTETVHNGRLFRFNCYSYKVDSLIPKMNTAKNCINPSITFPDGVVVHYEETDELNYTQVTIPCKSHHREKFKNAVESQLLYFDNVEFTVIDEDGDEDCMDIKASVLYNSENLIIADQRQYSKPHIVVVKDKTSPVGVAYGYVNFREMEMQDLFGNVGFKCPIRQVMRDATGKEVVLQDGIEVTPSRESVIWSDATRDYVKKAIEKATLEANVILEQQLDEKDFLVWLDKAKNILGSIGASGSNTTLKHLSSIIDKTQLSPNYVLDPTIKYISPENVFWGLSVRKIYKSYDYKKREDDIKRDKVDHWSDFNPNECYMQDGNTVGIKDLYLASLAGSFTTIRVLDEEAMETLIDKCKTDDYKNKWTKDYIDFMIKKRESVLKYLRASNIIKSYDDVVVPEDFGKEAEAKAKESEEQEKIARLTPQELRKLEEKTIVHYLKRDMYGNNMQPFSWTKTEIKISELMNSESNTYYSYGDDDSISILSAMLYKMRGGIDNNDKLNFIKVSKSMPKKFLRNHRHVDRFVQQKSDKKVGMSKELVHWTTAKLIADNMESIKFFRNYEAFNPELHNIYLELKAYKESNYKDNYSEYVNKYQGGAKFMNEIFEYTGKVAELQLFIREHKDKPEEIQNKSLELFGINTIEAAVGYNLEMYDKLQLLLNYSEPVKALFNHVNVLIDVNRPSIDFDTERMIKEVIYAKGLEDFQVTPIAKDESISEVEEVKAPLRERSTSTQIEMVD